MYDPRVFAERLTRHMDQSPGVLSFYEKHYGNIKYIDGLKSKWYVEDTILEYITQSLTSKCDFARNILNDSVV